MTEDYYDELLPRAGWLCTTGYTRNRVINLRKSR